MFEWIVSYIQTPVLWEIYTSRVHAKVDTVGEFKSGG